MSLSPLCRRSLEAIRHPLAPIVVVAAVLGSAVGSPGQELPVREEARAHPLAECPGWNPDEVEEPAAEARAEARALASTATEAALLGDPEGVRDFLRRATELNPRSEDLAYRRARAHAELGETEPAIRWYCRYLALAPDGEEAREVRDRLAELQEPLGPPIAEEALARFRQGVVLLEEGALEEAIEAFSAAISADSALADAFYNRGLARGALTRPEPAIRDFRTYLDLRPEAPDRARVEEAIQFLAEPSGQYSPGGAMTLGFVLPGSGHFYTGRPLQGALFLGVAAGAVAVGALYETVDVSCLTLPRDGRCPEDQIRSRDSDRPALMPGLAVAGVTALVSAITAYRGASSRNAAARRLRVSSPDDGADTAGGLEVVPPAVIPARYGVRIELLRLRF